MSIHNVIQKINASLGKVDQSHIFIPLIIVLVSSASFGLGRLSKIEELRVPIKIKEAQAILEQSATVALSLGTTTESNGETISAIGGQYVASKTGTKYHYPWCAGARAISEKNKIWFTTVEAAKAAGYQPAGNCKGLNK